MKNKPMRTSFPSSYPIRRNGFTLIEVLVVITIILVLATAIFMVTRSIKSKAYQANALNSLRQVAAFNVAYYTENNGDINTLRYPGAAKEGKPNWVSDTFWGRLQPYMFPDISTSNQKTLNGELSLRLDQLFSTSDSGKMVNTVISGSKVYHDGSGLPVPFAFNTSLYEYTKFRKVSEFSDPSQILYFTYGFAMCDEADGRNADPRPLDGSKPTNNIYYMEDKAALATFLDGHVESLKAPIPDRRFK